MPVYNVVEAVATRLSLALAHGIAKEMNDGLTLTDKEINELADRVVARFIERYKPDQARMLVKYYASARPAYDGPPPPSAAQFDAARRADEDEREESEE